MPKIKNYFLSLATVTASNVVLYFNGQLPSIKNNINDAGILTLWVICVVALSMFTFLGNNSQQNTTTGNINSPHQANPQSNWIGGLLLFIIGAVIYGLLQTNIIPEQSTTLFGYISLILCGFGAVVPIFLLIPEWWQNILLLLSSGLGIFIAFHYYRDGNLNALFISFIFTLLSVLLLAGRKILVQVISNVTLFWEELQHQQADKLSELIIDKLKDLVSPFKGNYYKALEYKCRDDETQGLDNEFTLELQKVFVPLKIAANNAKSTKQDIIPISRYTEVVYGSLLSRKDL